MRWNKPPYPRLTRALWTLYFAAGLALIVFADRWEAAHDEGVDSLPLRSALAAFLLVAVALPPCLAWLFHRYAATIDVDVLQERPRWLSPKAAFLALFLGMATGGFALYQSARASVTDATTQRLADVVTLKEHLIDHWLDEEVEDLRSWMASPQFIALLQEWRHVGYVEGPQHAQLVEYLHQLSKSSHFVEVGARDAVSGALLLSTTGDSDGETLRDQTLAAVKARKPVLEDFHRDVDRSSENYIGFLVPVIESGQTQIREVVHVGIDPEHGLFPLLYQWQGSATSAQTLLVQRRP